MLGNVEGCSDNKTVYLNDPNVPRCSRKSWLAMTMFSIYILITSIMLINLLIAIFRLCFLRITNHRSFHVCCVTSFNISNCSERNQSSLSTTTQSKRLSTEHAVLIML